MRTPRTTRPAAALALTAAAGLVLAAAAPAALAGTGEGTGQDGQALTVSEVDNLPADGTTVQVKGSGFDPGKGIYVALCQDNGEGEAPGPCGGGADMSGDAGASAWVSSNPPPYGRSLAVPYGPGGTFEVEIQVSAALGDSVDCTEANCAVVSRTDHTRGGDRSQDVKVPVTFGGGDGGVPVWAWAAGGAGGAAVLGAGVLLVLRRRRGTAEESGGETPGAAA